MPESKTGQDGRRTRPSFHLGTVFYSNGTWWVINLVSYTGASGWSFEAVPSGD